MDANAHEQWGSARPGAAQITRLTMNKKFNSFVHQIKIVFSVSDLTSFEVQEEEYLITKRKKAM